MKKAIALKTSVIAVALTLVSSQVVLAQETDDSKPMQKVVITGSNIKQIEAETAVPIQIIKRDEIQRLGVNSVKEVLDTLTSSTSGSLSDTNGSNSFAGGASSVNLRNLGKQSTLVLLNSRRVAPYALADYNEVFTNLDSLPLDAIDRIEVLRSGGSAIYGSDAVAGVINIITRTNYQGLQARASRDQSLKHSPFHTSTASITGGFGDLDKDRYNVLANLEVFQRGNVMWRSVVDDINPDYGKKFSAVADNSGLMFGKRGSPSTYSYPGNIIGQGPIAGCPTLNAGGLCVFDRYSRFEAIPEAKRLNFLLSGTINISDKVQSFSEVLFSNTKTDYTSGFSIYDSEGADAVWGDPRTGQAKTYTSRYLPANHPLNQTGDEAPLRYRFADSPAYRKSDSTQYRALTGLRGTWDKYDWETAIGVMGSKTTDRSRGAISDSGFKQVIGNYDPSQDDPLFFNRDYKIGQKNSDAVLNTLFPENGYDGKITQVFLDGKISGEIASYQGRPVSLAVGGDIRHESFKITPTANLQAGDIVSNGASSADASRNTVALFSELNFPLTSKLDLQAAVRADKYPDFAAHFSPKLALRYEASKELLLRATLESGFRAPNLTESAQSSKFAFDNGVDDPRRCPQAQALADALTAASNALPANDPNKQLLLARADSVYINECSTGVASSVVNNPNLKPETSRSATVGLVLEPVKGYNLSLDYWYIERRNEIGIKSTAELLAAESSLAPGTVNRLPLTQDRTFTPAEQAQYGVTQGPLSSTFGMFENVSKTKVSGIDVGASGRVNTGLGRLTLSGNATYLLELRNFASTLGSGQYGDNLAGQYATPKTVANIGASLQSGSYTNGLRLTYSSPTSLQGDYFDDGYSVAGCVENRGWTRADCDVGSTIRFDYNFSYTGIKNLTLSAFVRNVLNRRPPLDLKEFAREGSGIIPQNTDDVRGRSLRLTAEYKFF
ncbi:TonB-dependent receptor domain-containing protein [Janthinobacterium agaricidamnosum]|uniref:TonB-dependent Receptor Plug domain protein n=1 Tax=Janthinobacterium agaricidamnosum NBRC 102515 = DSM 9628 TaxID=1349767 RepID=W0V1A7_9BURK|nr:TonB-dependent receptor [Janthinobacterium agaricidamnosum]CDG82604.1 tonB-dependent Receptor Plug domain protein [Janthinobacterium agaricidamnosum NBRC 102515 = DSM 9628]